MPITSRTEALTILTECWCDVLGRSTVGFDENFFDLGGGSLDAIALHQELEDRLGIKLTVTEVLERATIRTFLDTRYPVSDSIASALNSRTELQPRRLLRK